MEEIEQELNKIKTKETNRMIAVDILKEMTKFAVDAKINSITLKKDDPKFAAIFDKYINTFDEFNKDIAKYIFDC